MAGTIVLATPVKEARSQALADYVDGGPIDPARLDIYSGAQPASPLAPVGAATLLGSLVVPKPFAATVANGILIANAFDTALATEGGVATWGRLIRFDDAAVADLTIGVTGGGANIEMANTNILAGSILVVTSVQISEA